MQFEGRPGIIDLGWGHPDPALLPVAELRNAAARVLDRYAADALNYGFAAGPGPFREFVCARLAEVDSRAPEPSAVVASAGNSQALDQVVTLLASPGDAVLVEDPTYHLAVRILRDHPVDLEPLPVDADGLRVDALVETLARLRAARRRARLLYTIPTFHNPTGGSLSDARRQALVRIAADAGLIVVEDDAYRELTYEGPPPPSLWSLAPPGVVIRLVSFSKSLAPGLRTGAIVSDPATSQRLAMSGVLDSGGGISHFTCLLVAEVGESGAYARHVSQLRSAYRQRRDALTTSLEAMLPTCASWVVPAGGYFVWLRLRGGATATELLAAAEEEGTSFSLGTLFFVGAGDPTCLRLAFSRYGPDELSEAGRRLGEAARHVGRGERRT